MERKTKLLFLFVLLPVIAQTSLCLPHAVECIDKTNKPESMTYLLGEENLTESPTYSIQLFRDRDSYDHGDKVLISVYITGGGNIEESRIVGHVPQNIISGNASLTLFKFAKGDIGEWEGWKPVVPPEKFSMGNRFVGILAKGYFTYQQDKPILWSEGEVTFENKSYPPISIEFTTSRDAPSGNHIIEFIFKYKSAEGRWSVSKEKLTIHIRSFVEKYALGITLLLSAIITACITAIFWILSRTR